MQKLQLIGNLGQDAVLRTPNGGGEQFLSFKIAVNDGYTNKEGVKVERTSWYECIFKRVKLAPFLKKGGKLFVEGKPSYETFTDKEGVSRVSVTVSVANLELLDKKPE